MKKKTLNYTFHDPNAPRTTAEFLARLFVEVNLDKVESTVKNATMEYELPAAEAETLEHSA